MAVIALGPVLYARPAPDPKTWSFSVGLLLDTTLNDDFSKLAVVMAAEAADAVLSGPTVVDRFPAPNGQRVFLRWDVELARQQDGRLVSYQLELDGKPLGDRHGLRVPALSELPRMAFFSCNGASAPKLWRSLADPFERWRDLQELHQKQGLNLVIGGGDQIYADSVLDLPGIAEHVRGDGGVRTQGPLSAQAGEELLSAYVKLYVERWASDAMRAVQASVPGVYTWDDHDIVDGWGSQGDTEQTPAFQAIFRQAARTFRTFQTAGLVEQHPDQGFWQALSISGGEDVVDLVLPDMRSKRAISHVLNDAQWKQLDAWLEQRVQARLPNGRRHLLFVSPVPVVHSRVFGMVEGLSTLTPLSDDLSDQWEAGKHRGERARLIMTLLEHQQLSKSAVTLLSGDVHMGVHAEIRSQNPLHLQSGETLAVINQLTSSGIVHPPPSRLEYFVYRKISSDEPDDLGQHVETRIVPLDDQVHLTVRNWLYLDFDRPREGDQDRARLWAEWRAGEHTPSRRVVVQPPSPR